MACLAATEHTSSSPGLATESLKILHLNCDHGQGHFIQKLCKLRLPGLGQVQRQAQQICGGTSFWHGAGLGKPGNTKLVCLKQAF